MGRNKTLFTAIKLKPWRCVCACMCACICVCACVCFLHGCICVCVCVCVLQGETKILKLKNLRPQDYAQYTCIASVRQVCGIGDKSALFNLNNRTGSTHAHMHTRSLFQSKMLLPILDCSYDRYHWLWLARVHSLHFLFSGVKTDWLDFCRCFKIYFLIFLPLFQGKWKSESVYSIYNFWWRFSWRTVL